MVGFNRRFAPLLRQLRTSFGASSSRSSARYLINAGQLEADSWYLNGDLEGSRFTGEGGHFIDTLSWWADGRPSAVYAVPGLDDDDVQATLRFENGSTATISYLTTGNPRFPKETLDISGGGRSARLDNFVQATVWTGRQRDRTKARGRQDKGQREQLVQFVQACRTGAPMPIAIESLAATTSATIAVGESLTSGKPVQM
jgi:predicted dehydrogenase